MHFFPAQVKDANQRAGTGFVELEVLGENRCFTGDQRLGVGLATGDFEDEFGGQCGSGEHTLRINTTLEAVARVAAQNQPARCAADIGGREVSGLNEDVLRRIGDACRLSAHDAGNSECLGFVSDDEIFRRQAVGIAIKGDDGFTFVSLADNDASFEFRCVEGVQWLADFEQHEVGDVHNVVDRAQAHALQPALQPLRTRTDLHILDGASGVERAGLRGVQLHLGGCGLSGG